MADKEENIKTTPTSATAIADPPPAQAEIKSQEREKAVQEKQHPKGKDKKAARFGFFMINFPGLHWVGNSTLSLWITYNLVPTRPAQALIEGLSKVMKPVAIGWEHIKTPFRGIVHSAKDVLGMKNGYKPLTELEKAENIAHNSRSFVETLCMCVAGCVILFPVKLLENHKPQILNGLDRLFHPFRKQAPAEHNAQPEQHEEKETWTNLIRARFVSLVPIFLIDNQVQKYNNSRYKAGKTSIDKALWKAGADIYDAKNETVIGKIANNVLDKVLPSNWREKVIAFFSRKNVTVAKVQDMVRPMILNTIGSPQELHDLHEQIHIRQERIKHAPNDKVLHKAMGEEIEALSKDFLVRNPHLKKDVERVVFAEQTRLFAKEWYLTLIYTGLLYFVGKTKTAARALEFMHLKGKSKPESLEAAAATFSAPKEEPAAAAEPTQKRWAEREENQPKGKPAAPAATFQESVAHTGKEATVSI